MLNYGVIFIVTSALNIVITFRSSGYCWRTFGKWCDRLLQSCSRPIHKAKTNATTTTKDPNHSQETTDDNNQKPSPEIQHEEKSKHATLLKKYLLVYLLACLGDWIQGPYIYALYASYGYTSYEIALLYTTGFLSSMIFGSFIGGMADACGRRRGVILFAAVYALSCFTKHFRQFSILVLGRILGGIAASLLYSVFDAWLIRAHDLADIDKSFLSVSFYVASYGKFCVAILSGLVADRAQANNVIEPLFSSMDSGETNVDRDGDSNVSISMSTDAVAPPLFYVGGCLNAFDIALFSLCLCGVFASLLWDENYGTQRLHVDKNDDYKDHVSDLTVGKGDDGEIAIDIGEESKDHELLTALYGQWMHRADSGIFSAITVTFQSVDVLICGLVSSIFEGCIYIFVYSWTPLLLELEEGKDEKLGEDLELDRKIPLGLIFATFMTSCMAGSSFYSLCSTRIRDEVMGIGVFITASISLAITAYSKSSLVTFLAFNIFEAMVGMYFPIMGTMKSGIVPEDKRAAIYNVYRIPVNIIVLFSLLTDLTMRQSVLLCSFMLLFATLWQFILTKRRLNISSMEDLHKRGLIKVNISIDSVLNSHDTIQEVEITNPNLSTDDHKSTLNQRSNRR